MAKSPSRKTRFKLLGGDLAVDRKAQTTPLQALAAPFRKALNGASEDEIARIVTKARSRRDR